jgi:hypothetical protein
MIKVRKDLAVWVIVAIAFMVGIIAVAVLPESAESYSSGITGRTRTGCTCHNPQVTESVVPSIEGLPESYKGGKVYELTIKYSGGPSPGSGATAGFNLLVSAGKLSDPSGGGIVRVIPNGLEATHTNQGNLNNQWRIDWTPPDGGAKDITMDLVVNVVNGDGQQSTADRWGQASFKVEGSGGSNLLYIMLISVVIVLVGFYAFRQSKKRTSIRAKKKAAARRGRGKSRRKGRG